MEERLNFTVAGNEFALSAAAVRARLQDVEPESIRELYVEVDGVQFPIKQAFAHVTGMPRGQFTSHDAMRVFRKLQLKIGPDVMTATERYYTSLKGLNVFDKESVGPVVSTIVLKTNRDTLVSTIYQRVRMNVESLLNLRTVRDFQAIAMVTRSLFELAIDMKLIDVVSDAVEKVGAFTDVEKIRAARKIVAYKAANPTSKTNATVHQGFIKSNESRVAVEQAKLWPGVKKIEHWSGLNLKQRVALLKMPYEEIYEVRYPQLSWYSHSAGVSGFTLKASSFELLAGSHFQLAGEFYMMTLTAVIAEYKIEKVDEKVMKRMKLALQLPFTDTDAEAVALEKALLG
jgi:hypothetical protein